MLPTKQFLKDILGLFYPTADPCYENSRTPSLQQDFSSSKKKKSLLILINIDFCMELLVRTRRKKFSFPFRSPVLDSCLVCGSFGSGNISEQNLIMKTPQYPQELWHSPNLPLSSTLQNTEIAQDTQLYLKLILIYYTEFSGLQKFLLLTF